MSIPGAASPLFLGAAVAEEAAFQIDRSVRLNSADSAYFSRTPSSASNRKTFTFSTWVKRHKLGTDQKIFGVNSNWFTFYFTSSDNLRVYYENSGSQYFTTDAVFRDVSAWYHIVLKVDTTQSTASDRVKIYVNSEELTFSATGTTSQNYEFGVNTTNAHDIGMRSSESNMKADFGLAEVNFIDGQALAPTDFGETDDNNNWNPKAYSGSYGTNGFHLDFSDATSTTTIAEDSSGNNNDWTANNLSVASGAGNDSLIDTPTNYEADSGNNGGNYATLNPLQSGATLANGNLDATSGQNKAVFATIAVGETGKKFYWEATINDSHFQQIGIADMAVGKTSAAPGDSGSEGYIYLANGEIYHEGSTTSTGHSTFTTGDIIGVKYDDTTRSLSWNKNGGSFFGAVTVDDGRYYAPVFGAGGGSDEISVSVNFGQRPFAYTPPSNHLPLVTTNLSDPTIADGSTAFDAVTYAGNGSTQSITGFNFQPDLVWIKTRNDNSYHFLTDSVRGVNKHLASNATDAEGNVTAITAFNSDGFSLANQANVNDSAYNYVSWCWDGGTSTATNTDGGTTANVRANASAGFSIVGWSGHGSGSTTIGHGLNAAPELIIIKGRTNAGAWVVGSDYIGWGNRLELNTTSASSSASADFNSTAPTSSVFTVGSNQGTGDKIAYCFAPVSQFSSFGSFTGNGSSDGPMVYTGFRPAFVMLKRTDSTASWQIRDTSRSPDNVVTENLYPNLTNTESTDSSLNLDILSNGFKPRTSTDGGSNASGGTYLYACFAEHPLKTARAR